MMCTFCLAFFKENYDAFILYHLEKIKRHCKSKMDLIEPVNYTLRNDSGEKIGNFSYVPITQVLRKYCSLEDVWEQIVIDGAKASGEVLREFTDGEYYKHHSFFQENPQNLHRHPQALRLHLYEDEFEIVNALGPKRISTSCLPSITL